MGFKPLWVLNIVSFSKAIGWSCQDSVQLYRRLACRLTLALACVNLNPASGRVVVPGVGLEILLGLVSVSVSGWTDSEWVF